MSAAQVAAVSAKRVRMCYLLECNFPSGQVCFTTAGQTIFYDNREWLGAGSLLEIKFPDEDSTLEVHNAELRTHVGVDGNGLTQQMKDLIGEVRGLRGDLTGAMEELAEHRGANRRAS